MSRIHDALKRAEQERATSTGTHVEPVLRAARSSTAICGASAGIGRDAQHGLHGFRSEQRVKFRIHAFALPADGMEAGPEDHALFRGRRKPDRCRRVSHVALAPLPDPREDGSETAAGDERASERREVFRGRQPGPGTGAAARAPRPGDRRRSAQPGHASPPGSAADTGAYRNICWANATNSGAAAGAHGKSVFHAGGPHRDQRSGTAGQRPSEAFLQRVEPLFDWIIIDTSPVIPVRTPRWSPASATAF